MKVKKLKSTICISIALILGELFYFRELFGSRQILGINVDPLFLNMLMEHWYDVLDGTECLNTLRSFYPATGSFGYSDIMLLPGLVYSFFRFFGIKSFLAFNYAFILIHFCGVLLLYKTLRTLGCSYMIAFAGLFFSLWSCSFTQLSYHVQFFCISTMSLFFLSVVNFYKNRKKGLKKRFCWAILATVAIGLTFLSASYIAYFTILIVAGALTVFVFFEHKKRIIGIFNIIRNNIKEVLLYSLMQVSWVAPLIYLYFPKIQQHGFDNTEFSWAHAPEIYDIFRTCSRAPIESLLSCWLPSYLPESISYYLPNRIMETSYGWAFITVILFIITLISLFKLKKKSIYDQMIISIGIVIVFWYILTCRYGEFYPWAYISSVLPGADSIRAPGRYLGICTPFLSIVICVWLRDNIEKLSGHEMKKEIVISLILIIIVAISNQAIRYMRDDIEEIEAGLERIAPPPENCTEFFICPIELESMNIFDINLYAWLMADRFRIYTLNGYSGDSPLGWDLLPNNLHDYYENVRYWIEINGLQDDKGLYGYIMGDGIWVPYSEINISFADS